MQLNACRHIDLLYNLRSTAKEFYNTVLRNSSKILVAHLLASLLCNYLSYDRNNRIAEIDRKPSISLKSALSFFVLLR